MVRRPRRERAPLGSQPDPVTLRRWLRRWTNVPHDISSRYAGRELTMHGLGDDEAEVVGEAIRKPLTPVRRGICITECGLHPDFAIAQFDREDWYVVRPQIEGAAAFEIEAGVVPMTGQDAILDAAALKRETHVRTPIIEGEDAPAVVHDKDRTMTAVENEPALRLQLIKAAREHKFPASPMEIRAAGKRSDIVFRKSDRCISSVLPSFAGTGSSKARRQGPAHSQRCTIQFIGLEF
jgi:hypothetical protein